MTKRARGRETRRRRRGACRAGMLLAGFLLFGVGGSLQAQTPPRPSPARADEFVSLDFDNADIRVVIKHISELIGRNFLVDAKVRGRVTIITPTKVRIGDVYQVFISILHTYGFTAMEAGGVTRILPLAETSRAGGASVTPSETAVAAPSERVITAIFKIEHAEPGQLAAVLRPLAAQTGSLVSYGNALVLTDTAANVRRLTSIVQALDVPPEDTMAEVIRLKFALAPELADILSRLVEDPGGRTAIGVGQPRPGPPIGVPGTGIGSRLRHKNVRIIPDERVNAIVLLAPPLEMVRLKGLMLKLDIPAPPERKRVHVYRLENAIAEELAKVLTQQIEARTETTPTRAGGTTVTRGPGGRTAITPPPPPTGSSGGVRGAGTPILTDVTITPDKATNSLIIRASPEDFQALTEIIRGLDFPRSQVLVEALIAEMTLEKAKELGVEWRILSSPREGETRAIGGTNLPLAGRSQGVINQFASAPFGGPSGLVLGATRGTVTFGGQTFMDLRGLIRAFQTDSDINILSTPQILTTDNEEAEIIVGENRPFVTQSQTTAEGSTVQTFEFRDLGVKLRITPHISPNRSVRLKIFQEITNFISESQVGAVTTTKRQASTSVAVEDAQTVVIGGLIRDDLTDQETKVPLLGDLPILSGLFRSQSKRKIKTNLLIFITPRVVTTPEEQRRITDLKKGETGQLAPSKPPSAKEKM